MFDVKPSTDERLWLRWRAERDGGAFEAAVRPHVRFAADFARRLGLADDDADEVVQESLIGLALERRDKPAHVGLRAWLGRSVRNRARMLFRSRSRRRAHEQEPRLTVSAALPGLDVRDEVEAVLATLSDGSRLAVELRYLHDMEYADIGYVLGTTALGARIRVHRSVGRLRRRLGPKAPALLAALPMLGDRPFSRSFPARAARQALASPPLGAVPTFGGLLVMGMAAKVAAAVALAAVAAWFAWPRPASAPPRAVAAVSDLAAPDEVLAPRPALAGGAAARSVGPAANSTTPVTAAMVPLDEPIPPGTGSVFGVLKFQDGTPLRGAKVALWGESPIECVTDDQGRYHLHGDWVASRQLYLKGDRHYDSLGLVEVEMKLDRRVEASPAIDRGVEIVAVVRAAATQAPVADAFVSLRRPREEFKAQAGFGFATTDSQGRFRFAYVPRAVCTLDVTASGFEPRVWKLDLAKDAPPTELALSPARWLVLHFENLSEEARRVPLSWMIQAADNPSTPQGKTPIDDRGDVKMEAPPPGTYRLLLFEAAGRPRIEMPLVIPEGAFEPVVIQIPVSGRIEATILDATGQPLPDARLSFQNNEMTPPDAEGRLTMARAPVGRGPLWLVFGASEDHGDGILEITELEVKAGETQHLALRLPGSASITGRFDLGEEAGSVMVVLQSPGAVTHQVATVRADPRGRFRIPFLAAGNYHLFTLATERPQANRDISLRDGESLELGDILLHCYPEIPVEVVLPSGAARPAEIDAHAFGPVREYVANGRVTFKAGGRAVLRGIPEGTYEVMFSAVGFAPLEKTVTILAGDMTPVRLELVPK